MATSTPTPDTSDQADQPATDLVSFKEASALLEGTGLPSSDSTLQRVARKARIRVRYVRRAGKLTGHVSYSDLLVALNQEYVKPLPPRR